MLSDEQRLKRKRLDLINHFKAKPKESAKDNEYLVTYTERNLWILSPRSGVTKQRKVVIQL